MQLDFLHLSIIFLVLKSEFFVIEVDLKWEAMDNAKSS